MTVSPLPAKRALTEDFRMKGGFPSRCELCASAALPARSAREAGGMLPRLSTAATMGDFDLGEGVPLYEAGEQLRQASRIA